MLKMSKCIARLAAVTGVLLVALLSGCATTTRNTTSAVDYLYPDKQNLAASGVPTLALPLRVGIAFAPGNIGSSEDRTSDLIWKHTRPSGGGSSLTEKQKLELTREVGNRFRKYPFVRNIEFIPSDYLEPRGGFANLDQIGKMFGVDEIVLISYDQTQFVDEGLLSLSYLTLVGAYMAPGEKSDTQTILSAVVVDIPSRKMLFHAQGSSTVKGGATPVNRSQGLRDDSNAGFREATDSMIESLDGQLAAFRARIKDQPEDYTVIRPEGYKETGN